MPEFREILARLTLRGHDTNTGTNTDMNTDSGQKRTLASGLQNEICDKHLVRLIDENLKIRLPIAVHIRL